MKAVVSVLGKDSVGILAKVSKECADVNANAKILCKKCLP